MPYVLVSPYPDDLTRTEDVPKIIEDWIEEKWDEEATTVPKEEVAFGKYGDELLQVRKADNIEGLLLLHV